MLSLKFVFDRSERQPELNHGLPSSQIGMGVVAYCDGTQVETKRIHCENPNRGMSGSPFKPPALPEVMTYDFVTCTTLRLQ